MLNIKIHTFKNNTYASMNYFFILQTDLCLLGSELGMDVVPLRSNAGPYHHHNNFHHHTDQTKSLQELQHEVGALLEFRDLVIETFPDLKHKMASSAANSTITGLASSSSIVSRYINKVYLIRFLKSDTLIF